MPITDWPIDDRPREKLQLRGAAALSDAELLAIFLRTGIAGKSAVDLARDVLKGAGGLKPLLEQDQATFCRAKGLGSAKYAQLQATLELGRRYLSEELKCGESITDPAQVIQFLQAHLAGHQVEMFAVLFLDSQHRMIAYETLFEGTVDCTAVYPREVVKRGLAHNAAAVVLAHNHPSGCPEPSQEDIQLTHQLREALGLVGIRVLDHVVIGHDEAVAFSARGML